MMCSTHTHPQAAVQHVSVKHAMLALALTLHVDPVFVGAHHLSRFIFVSIATPGIVHLYGKAQDDLDD